MIDGWLRRRVKWYLKRHEVLEAHSRREGACARCGACCMHCLFHDAEGKRCRIYKMRLEICRNFPLTDKDIENIPQCGFRFKKKS